MDRVLVFRSGTLARELTHAEASREALVSAYFGRGTDRPSNSSEEATR
jgi:ABC-type sugar transport system ATPase subunit